MNQYKLSIITINYNNRDGLRKTIESVVNQTCKEFQYIIIDGGSTDGSVEVIKEYADRIDYWVSEPDRGIYHAMNKGIDKAEGKYCIFMNSGDCFATANTLDLLFPELDGTEIVNGDTLLHNGECWYAPKQEDLSLSFFYVTTLVHQSTCIKTELLQKFHYDETLKIVSDWKFWLQALLFDNVSYKQVNFPVSLFDMTGLSYTQVEESAEEHEFVLKQLFPERVLKDIRNINDSYEARLYNGIRKSRIHKTMYTINVLILRAMSLFKKGKSWTDSFPLQLK